MEFEGELAVVGGDLVDGPPELSSFPGGELASFSPPPAFGAAPSPGSNSFAPPPAFGGTPAFGTAGAFGDASPSRSFGKAPPSASQSFGPTIAATAPPVVNPWGTPGPLSSPPSARAASSSFGALPQSPSLHASTLASLEAPPLSAPSTGSWGSNPTLVVSSEEQQAYAAAAMAALSAPPPLSELHSQASSVDADELPPDPEPVDAPDAIDAPQSWDGFPTRAVSAAEVNAARSMASAPASLSGLFDGINGAPAAPAAPTPVASATDDVGDMFNFSLEPGSTIEPAPDAAAPSPFAADAAVGELVHQHPRPTDLPGAHEIPQELPSHMASSPPPGATVDADRGFAEISLDAPVEESFEIEDDHGDGHGDLASSGPPLADFSSGPAFADFAPPDDVAPAGAPEPAFPELPAPPLMDFGGSAEALPAPPPLSTFMAATREPFPGLSMTVEPGPVDDLPAPPLMDFGHAPPASAPGGIASGIDDGIDEASFADVGPIDNDVGEVGVDVDAELSALGDLGPDAGNVGAPDIPVDDFDADMALEGLDDPLGAPLPPPTPSTGPSLSSRVGLLAETLEEAGRFADAALLYEVQATLSTLGR